MIRRIKTALRVAASQFGIDPTRTVAGLRALPTYMADLRRFRRRYDGPIGFLPSLHDRSEEGGDTYSEYFIQDLVVAKRIFAANPRRHVDVGSRVDGFVAHVAAFRTIEVMDIRPNKGQIEGIVFKQVDLMNADASNQDYCDSLSCLHALEHFGLGRYGDSIDPLGWRSGLSGLAQLLTRGGRLYLSTPVGREKVMFNSHRVFSPRRLIDGAGEAGLLIDRLSSIIDGKFEVSQDIEADTGALQQRDYSLGIFEFIKV